MNARSKKVPKPARIRCRRSREQDVLLLDRGAGKVSERPTAQFFEQRQPQFIRKLDGEARRSQRRADPSVRVECGAAEEVTALQFETGTSGQAGLVNRRDQVVEVGIGHEIRSRWSL